MQAVHFRLDLNGYSHSQKEMVWKSVSVLSVALYIIYLVTLIQYINIILYLLSKTMAVWLF